MTAPRTLLLLTGLALLATSRPAWASPQDAPSPRPGPVPGSAPASAPSPRPADPATDRPDLRAGDQLSVRVIGRGDLGATVTVLSEGNVDVPFVGKVRAIGRTLAEIAADVSKALETYERDPKVSVTIQSMEDNQFFAIGAFGKAGAYRFPRSQRLTLLQALGMAGGFGDEADSAHLTLAPAGGRPRVLDGTPGRGTATMSQEYVQNGDTLVVGPIGRIYLMGQVNRTGGFVPPSGERMTLTRAIALAGGFTRLAKTGAVLVTWRGPDGSPVSRTYNVPRILEAGDEDPEVFPGNLINVPERAF